MAMGHIEVTKRAIEFGQPAYVPLETIDVPGLYDDFGRLARSSVEFIEGTEDCDVVQANFSYVYSNVRSDPEGNVLRTDEWHCTQMVPHASYNYLVIEHSLADWASLSSYRWPSSSAADPYFLQMKEGFDLYPDRFKVGYLDPGPFELAQYILGFENFLVSIKLDIDRVKYVFGKIIEYQMDIANKWKEVGAHMVNVYDILASRDSLLINPDLWREHFKPFYKKFFCHVHSLGMYAGYGIDGNALAIIPDLKEVGLDVLEYREPMAIGIDTLAKVCGGRMCCKCSIDMQKTLREGTPDEIWRQAEELVNSLGSRNGGFIAQVYSWPVLRIPEENIKASVQAFNYYRKRIKY